MCAPLAVSRRISSATCAFSSSAESGLPASSTTVATSDTGSAGTTSPTFCISVAPSRSISAKRRVSSSVRKSMPRSVTYWRSDTGLPKLTQA